MGWEDSGAGIGFWEGGVWGRGVEWEKPAGRSAWRWTRAGAGVNSKSSFFLGNADLRGRWTRGVSVVAGFTRGWGAGVEGWPKRRGSGVAVDVGAGVGAGVGVGSATAGSGRRTARECAGRLASDASHCFVVR